MSAATKRAIFLTQEKQQREQAKIKVSGHYVSQLMDVKRKEEKSWRAVCGYQEALKKATLAVKMEDSIRDRRRTNMKAKMAAEAMMEENLSAQEAMQRNQSLLHEQNDKLANEIEKRSLQKENAEREIQRICAESDELKDLEKKLKIGYINKERAAQHQERQVLEKMERERDQAIDDFMETQRQQSMIQEIEKTHIQKMKAGELRDSLHKQIEERKSVLEEAALEAEKDKDMIDNIMKKIYEDERAEIDERNRRKDETKRVLRAYEVQRKQEVLERKAAEAAEQAEIRAYLDGVASREGAEEAKKEAKKKAAESALEKIVEEQKRRQAEEEEMIYLQELLIDEEAAAAREAADKAKRDKEMMNRLETMKYNEIQKKITAQQRADEAKEEKRLIEIMLKKFANDDRIEKEKEQRRHQAKLDYRNRIAEQRAERRDMYEAEKAAAREAESMDGEKDEFRKNVIMEARKRLLSNHAAKLMGFLPKNTLKSKDEWEMINQTAAPGY